MDTASPIGFIAKLDKTLMPAEDAANLCAGLAIFALMVLGVLQIVMRTLFNSPIPGYIDLVELSMASMAFLGVAYCQRLGAHIRMELIIGKLNGRILWIVEAVGAVVALAVVATLIWYSAGHFWRSFTLGDTTMDAEFAVWPSKLLVPIAFTLWFLRLLIQFAGSVRLAGNPELEKEGVIVIKDVADQAKDEIHDVMGDIDVDKEPK